MKHVLCARRPAFALKLMFVLTMAGCAMDVAEGTAGAPPFEPELDGQRLICGRTQWADNLGGIATQEEFYHLDRINRVLGDDAELRAMSGLERVSTCDEAARFAEADRELDELDPERIGVSYLDEAAAEPEFSAEALAAARENPVWVDDPEIPKLLNGVPVHDTKVVAIRNHTQGHRCTAIPFGRRQWNGAEITDFLTAAHCANNDGVMDFEFFVSSNSSGTPVSLGRFFTSVARNPNYTGLGDPGDDIAVLMVLGLAMTSLNDLYTGALTTSTSMFPFGTGTSSATTVTPIITRMAISQGSFQPDTINSKFFVDSNDAEVFLCVGDSGGPARLGPMFASVPRAVGVASEVDAFFGQHCRGSGLQQRWTRISAHTTWIQNTRGTCSTSPQPTALRCF